MDRFSLEDVVVPDQVVADTPLKEWRLKYQAGTIQNTDFVEFFQKESRKYFEYGYQFETVKCTFKEANAKEGIIDVLLEFIFGDNPQMVLDKLRLEGNTAGVCGKVFKNGEPTYSCRECGMDPTCVLCVNCFKKSAHRYHKYKMSTSGGGGCCDCGDEEAWKKDHYCEDHLRGKDYQINSNIITEAIKERCELACVAILSFCVNFLEIETNASLECLDGNEDGDDYFCTVLYNDESHTFDQVIQTLTKIVQSRHKDAMDIVASIDREGRAVVKCDSFYECCQLKEAIEKQSVTAGAVLPSSSSRSNQSLRVSVLHVRAVASQQFALQLLTWLQEFVIRHSTFRQIFAKVIMDKRAVYNIRHILEYDVKLWKTARACWHRLLISGLLMEYDNKMALAQEFSRHYATIMQDFIRDDHEHSFSIVSLSVQLFTVPSIAHYLIANECIFYKLLHTFFHEAIEKYRLNKTLHFTKNMASLSIFKRAAYILYDLRYILSFKPDSWTKELREGFLEGCKGLLRLLDVMQGMESVTRQTGEHMDYEPEWESAFNLHIKLASTISLVIEWCASDREVLVKLYQMVMRHLDNNGFIVNDTITEEKTVGTHVANCILYDVGTRPVSIHLPLTRLFAGIYLHMGAHGMTFDNAVVNPKRTPEQIIEPILCTQVMIAQVHSGMWRRNGYSLLHQLYFYRNVRCRGEMLDRDIVCFQIGASLIESNQFLIHLLNKFNLLDWIQPNYEATLNIPPTDDEFARILSMIDEFLELLIVIIGERYMPGVSNVTEAERIKKEIIQLLCIKSFSHSELSRALPDSNNDTALEDVIDSVAVFKKPQMSDAKGVYVLKEELYDEYNLYFYHYTKEDKSKSEETQRLRCKARAELICCPPPKLPKLTNIFISIANLLQCDVMMEIISTVLRRALDWKAKSFVDYHFQKVLHLIGYGLQEEQSEHYPFLSFYERSKKYAILENLEELCNSARVAAHRDFILWTLKKFNELQAKVSPPSGELMQSDDSEAVSFATTSASTTTSQAGNKSPCAAADQEMQEKVERRRLAAERRAKIMAQIQSAQKSFMNSHAELFGTTNIVAEKINSTKPPQTTATMEWQEMTQCENCEDEGAVAYTSVACLGVDRRFQQPVVQNFKCILCFEDCTVNKDGPTVVYPAFVQKSKVLPMDSTECHTSSCGHVMHSNCWQEYYNNEESKEQRRLHRTRPPFAHSQPSNDFQCPYCRCLSNTVLPLTAPLSKYSVPNVIHAEEQIFPMDLWLEVMKVLSEEINKLQNEDKDGFVHSLLPTWDVILKSSNPIANIEEFERIAQPVNMEPLPESYNNYVNYYMKGAHPNEVFSDPDTRDGLRFAWHSCIYTVQSLEVYLRHINKPLKDEMSIRHKSCLSGLIRLSCLRAAHLQKEDIEILLKPVSEMLDTVLRQKGAPVVEWSCFRMMVSMILMVPNMLFTATPNKSIVANGSMMDFYTLQLFYLANVVKAIVLFEVPKKTSEDDTMDVDEDDKDINPRLPYKHEENIVAFYRKYNMPARREAYAKTVSRHNVTLDTQQQRDTQIPDVIIKCDSRTIEALFNHVKMEMQEFLRCCCLFFHFVTDVEFPDELSTIGSSDFEYMCKYLGLQPKLEMYFDNESFFATILNMFASHPDIVDYDFTKELKPNGLALNVVPCTNAVPMLRALPVDYSDLINSVSDFICPNSEREEMKSPSMCLICGEILCGQSYCCQPQLDTRNVGACTYHAHFCGAEIGLFLRIRDCQIVYLGRNKGCFVQTPYLDEYGETDPGLRRGNPLRLCSARYSKIHLTWLGHGLHEEIARFYENNSVTVTQWHHM